MDFLSKHNLTAGKLAKLFGAGVACAVLLAFLVSIVGSAFQGTSVGRSRLLSSISDEIAGYGGAATAPAPAPAAYLMKEYADGDASLSVRNILPPGEQGSAGADAEEYEVVQYSAAIESRNLAEDCGAILDLKKDPDIIFEQSNESDHACTYTFKVKKSRTQEVLAVIAALDPRDVSESTQTIKNRIEDFTSELEILEEKQKSINETLESALKSYQDITALATRTQDVESLTRIIESKIQIIERLTQERLRVSEQLDRLARSKAQQLDRLEYTFFHVSVSENKYFDAERIADSWKASFRRFFLTVNQAVQDATIGVVAVLFAALQYVIYLVLILVVAKYGWRFAQRIWNK